MAIKQTLTYTAPEGKTYVSLISWAKNTLSKDEFELFLTAEEKQRQFLQEKANSIDTETGVVIFADESAKQETLVVGGDRDFLNFWQRYLLETGTIVNETTENI